MQTYPLEEVLRVLAALRQAAGLPPEQFPVPAFVGMISDEMDTLRGQGKTDEEIAQLIAQNSNIEISADTLRQNYAPPGQRHRPE